MFSFHYDSIFADTIFRSYFFWRTNNVLRCAISSWSGELILLGEYDHRATGSTLFDLHLVLLSLRKLEIATLNMLYGVIDRCLDPIRIECLFDCSWSISLG
jgi:hypothetical protein